MKHVVQSGCLDASFRYSDFVGERLDHIPVVDIKSIGLYSTQRHRINEFDHYDTTENGGSKLMTPNLTIIVNREYWSIDQSSTTEESSTTEKPDDDGNGG